MVCNCEQNQKGRDAILKLRKEIKLKYNKKDKAVFLGGFFRYFFDTNPEPFYYQNFLNSWAEYIPEDSNQSPEEMEELKHIKMFCFNSASFRFKAKKSKQVFQDNKMGGYIIRSGREEFYHNPEKYLLDRI